MRPIDADRLKDTLKQLDVESNDIKWKSVVEESIHRIFPQIIDDEPTIDAELVKRGQWIHHAGMNSKCSCCGRYFPVAEFEQRPFDVNFCIHCGAKMDGGDKNA